MADLKRLLSPRSIAVVGGGFWGRNVIEECRKIGFDGEIWPVHPKHAEVAGRPAISRLSDLPEAPDAAFVAVNRDLTIETVGALSAMGAGGAICFASGFREALGELSDGADLQDALLEAAGEMPILGPNCYGLLNYLDGATLWPDQHGGTRVDRGVAIIMQSSNIAINLTMQSRGLPIAYVVTVGNQAQTGLSAVARALLADDRVTALGLHIEGIDDLEDFQEMAEAARRVGKPVIALKIGKSEQAQAATISHTASLAGSDAGARALLARLGIGQAETLPVFLETLKLLHVTGPLASHRIASMSCSGGEASLMADMAHDSDLCFPELVPEQSDALRAALGPRVALANPLDYHTYIWGDVDALAATFSAMMLGELAIGCVVLDFPRADRCDPSAWEPVIEAVARAQAATGKPMAILASLPETLPEATAQRLVAMGIMPFSGMETAISAMEIAADMGIARPRPERLTLPPATQGLLAPAIRTLTEAEAKSALAAHGVRVPGAVRARGTEEAADAATSLGFPVVLKGEGIAHKTEAGAVVLGLQDAASVASAAAAMPTESFLVEEMVTGTVAELLVGVVADPAHGYVLTLAAGGILTELLADSTSLLVPASRETVQQALSGLRSARLLNGYRGASAVDIDAVVDTIMAVQSYVTKALPEEIEINPLMCGPTGAVAADALIRTGNQT